MSWVQDAGSPFWNKGSAWGPDIVTMAIYKIRVRRDLILTTRLCRDGGGPHHVLAVSSLVHFPESRPAGLGLLGLSP